MAKRKIRVKAHKRKLKSGKSIVVKSHIRSIEKERAKTNKFIGTIPKGSEYEPFPEFLTEDITKEISAQDKAKTARITFLHGNSLWERNRGTYDVYKFDAKNVPIYSNFPKKVHPFQIIKIGNKFYLGNEHKHFKRIMSPDRKKKHKKRKGIITEGSQWREQHTAILIGKGQRKRAVELAKIKYMKKKIKKRKERKEKELEMISK